MQRARHPHLQPLATHATAWDPASVKVTLNLRLDGCIVPTSRGGARVDYAHLVRSLCAARMSTRTADLCSGLPCSMAGCAGPRTCTRGRQRRACVRVPRRTHSQVVLDNFLDEPTRSGLWDFLTNPRDTHADTAHAAPGGSGGDAAAHAPPRGDATHGSSTTCAADPPASKWQRATADAAAHPATWGLRPEQLAAFAQGALPAKLEVQSRLCKL
jgi:hypothetical protein